MVACFRAIVIDLRIHVRVMMKKERIFNGEQHDSEEN